MSDDVHDKSHVSETFGSALVHSFKTVEDFIDGNFSRSNNIKGLFECGLEAAFNDVTW
jgi:hypothetical protein